eukprot:scaffold1602_cov151-Amphora_coffeaeformis.AAC.1
MATLSKLGDSQPAQVPDRTMPPNTPKDVCIRRAMGMVPIVSEQVSLLRSTERATRHHGRISPVTDATWIDLYFISISLLLRDNNPVAYILLSSSSNDLALIKDCNLSRMTDPRRLASTSIPG